MLLYSIIQIFFDFLRFLESGYIFFERFQKLRPETPTESNIFGRCFMQICILNFLQHYMRLMENYLYLLGVKSVCLCLKLNL